MVLLIDIGNTNTVIGGLQGEDHVFVARVATDHKKTADETAVQLYSLMRLHHLQPESIQGVAISSVVPGVKEAYDHAITLLAGEGIERINIEPGIKTGINIRLDNPAQLGADLLCGAVAAYTHYGAPVLVIDMGTATTFTAVDRDGNLLGGSIMPGVKISLETLTRNTSQLPQIGLEGSVPLLGRNTIDAMKSGVILGAAGMVDSMSRRYRELWAKT